PGAPAAASARVSAGATCISHATSAAKHASAEPGAASPSATASGGAPAARAEPAAPVSPAPPTVLGKRFISIVMNPSLRRRSARRARETLAHVARAIVRLLLLDSVAPPEIVGFALLDEPIERIALQACRDPLRARRL